MSNECTGTDQAIRCQGASLISLETQVRLCTRCFRDVGRNKCYSRLSDNLVPKGVNVPVPMSFSFLEKLPVVRAYVRALTSGASEV